MTALVLAASIVVAIVLEAWASPKTSVRGGGGSGIPLRALAAAAGGLLLLASIHALRNAETWPLVMLGAGFIGVGGWLRASAMRNLGTLFRTEAGAARLVTHGVHAVMRHPSELGFIAWVLGLCIAAPTPFAIVVALLQLPLLVFRLRIEEAALAKQFGEQWVRYATRTRRFGF